MRELVLTVQSENSLSSLFQSWGGGGGSLRPASQELSLLQDPQPYNNVDR